MSKSRRDECFPTTINLLQGSDSATSRNLPKGKNMDDIIIRINTELIAKAHVLTLIRNAEDQIRQMQIDIDNNIKAIEFAKKELAEVKNIVEDIKKEYVVE